IIHEVDLLQSIIRGECTADAEVMRAAKPMHGIVRLDDSLAQVQEVFDDENVAMVVEDAHVVGVISKIDMVEFLAARS
ncbi:MAG: CBS domain-containing protein, partial [Rhodospirillaceae bacterium]|nr:CBS domain-containing protein [Rhodospirillaceae bacterium]